MHQLLDHPVDITTTKKKMNMYALGLYSVYCEAVYSVYYLHAELCKNKICIQKIHCAFTFEQSCTVVLYKHRQTKNP